MLRKIIFGVSLLVILIAGILLLTQPKNPLMITLSPDEKYFTLNLSPTVAKPLKLSGMNIKNEQENLAIPQGAEIFFSGQVNTLQDIWLKSGEKAYLILDASPVGVSFRANNCSGYLEEYQEFTPKFMASCPHNSVPQNCQDHLPATCRGPIKTGVIYSSECLPYVLTLNYNTCVNGNLKQENFLKEWRIYLK